MEKRHVNVALVVLGVLVAGASAFALYVTFQPAACQRYQCFQEHMVSCSSATFVNEEPEASWLYQIVRRERTSCEIRVTLLQAKEGDLKLRMFEGHDMLCTYALGVIAYPDKDLSLCHGLLKEDLQGLIIEKLHSYLINNLQDIKKELKDINITV